MHYNINTNHLKSILMFERSEPLIMIRVNLCARKVASNLP